MNDRQPRQAIALSYDGQQAPSLTAKGDDSVAEAILALAREHDVPIYENAELVRLLARLELGEQIPEALYLTIAEIIAFAWQLRGKVPVGFDDEPPGERDITPAPPLMSVLPGDDSFN
ncbi:EscU/YscU/HrcU family type III secretion system export apparatus switch protein [Pseudomonas putida]|uniref:EscU/YscU/HrcU family type III secretion system export apparatus switch protein n=1 Tax=Pseudomonas putida TaxID=303 RepID=UPI000DF8CE41|nr:EscU/YscU/HrcU family type III secretion system export apparatus switch protein [Pseudomonas putida]SUD77562.1 flagellar protein FhlB-like protein [Pseudomonas putida]